MLSSFVFVRNWVTRKIYNVLTTAGIVFVANNLDGRFHDMLAKYVYGRNSLPSLVYTNALQLPCHYTIVASRRTLKPTTIK